MKDLVDYRSIIYDKYASCFQQMNAEFDIQQSRQWAISYDTYLKGWLPDQKDSDILEVACGGGRLLHFLKSRGYVNLTGVDISSEQVSLARQVSDNVIQSDVLNFFESSVDTYDLIIGLDIIEHFHKDEALQFLEYCYRALRPGGRLILQTPNATSPFGTSTFYGDFTHEICFTPEGLHHLMKLYAFQNIDYREAGPVIHGLVSAMRFVMWHGIRQVIKLWNLTETGGQGAGVFTRVFLISGCKS